MNEIFAVIKEVCPICGQGRLLVAIDDSTDGNLFVLCEDCESEWDSPDVAHDIEMATRDRYKFLKYATIDDLRGTIWGNFLNK